MRSVVTGSRRQRGAVAVLTGLTIAVLIGFLGIAVDLGRMFVIKSEIQTALYACALAAASQLRPGLSDPNALVKADTYGRSLSDASHASVLGVRPDGSVNRVNFQALPVPPASIEISFASSLNGSYSTLASGAISPNVAKFARCTYPMTDVPVYFMRVLNAMTQTTVAATAVATLQPSQSACGFPLAVCKDPGSSAGSSPPFGLDKGEWVSGLSKKETGEGSLEGGSGGYGTGNFGWIDFTPPAGGASELEAIIRSPTGMCDLKPGDEVGEAGVKASLADAWNSRFGIYDKIADAATSPPDRTGFSYNDDTWPAKANAYEGAQQTQVTPSAGAGVNSNYKTNRAADIGYQGNDKSGQTVKYKVTSNANGRDRRLVAVPVVDCGVWGTGGANPPIEAFACVLLLSPMTNPGAGSFPQKVEYLGLANAPGNPCATSGLGGGSIGPLVPVLVQ